MGAVHPGPACMVFVFMAFVFMAFVMAFVFAVFVCARRRLTGRRRRSGA